MKLPEPVYEAMSTLYSPGAVTNAKQRLADTRKELTKWLAEAEELRSIRITLADSAAKSTPEIREFLDSEVSLLYNNLAQAEGKAATCNRRIEELETFLRRASKVIAWML